jgi:hypothetical protein
MPDRQRQPVRRKAFGGFAICRNGDRGTWDAAGSSDPSREGLPNRHCAALPSSGSRSSKPVDDAPLTLWMTKVGR